MHLGGELLDYMITLTFNLLGNCQTVLHSDCLILCPHQLCVRVPISAHPHQHVALSYSDSHPCGHEGVAHRGFKWFLKALLSKAEMVVQRHAAT